MERSLPDPQVTFQMDIQEVVTSLMPGLMMNFPGLGKLRAAAAVASAESQVKYFAFQTASLQSAYAVERAYYQLYFLEEKLRVNRENLSLLADLARLAQAQNEVGKATLQDVLRAQIEQGQVETEIANLEDSRNALLAQFKAALGLGADEPSPPVPQRFESVPLELTSDKVFEAALAREHAAQRHGGGRAGGGGLSQPGLQSPNAGCQPGVHGGCEDESYGLSSLGNGQPPDLAG